MRSGGPIAAKVVGWLAAAVAVPFPCTGKDDPPPEPAAKDHLKDQDRRGIPGWAYEARWYHVVVPRFCNGDPSNDPEGVLPWPAQGKPPAQSTASRSNRSYGGDLRGLQQRLPYLQELHFNTLYLTGLFRAETRGTTPHVELRHIADTVGVKDGPTKATSLEAGKTQWGFTRTDRLFLTVVKEAHKSGFRVILRARFAEVSPGVVPPREAERFFLAITRRWMDPDADGDPSDGIDGWIVTQPEKLPHAFWKRWRATVKRLNKSAVLVVDSDADPEPWLGGDEFDTAINRRLAQAVRRFFAQGGKPDPFQAWVADLKTLNQGWGTDARRAAAPLPLSGPKTGRLLSGPASKKRVERKKGGAPAAHPGVAPLHWQLAAILQYFSVGTPMVFYGDEVGMYNTRSDSSLAPMWWPDLSDPAGKPNRYRDEFATLIQWLNFRRDVDEPLRRGTFRVILADEDRRVLALARTLPGNEVILVMNFSDAKQKVLVPAGKPGRLVGLLTPQRKAWALSKRSRERSQAAGDTQDAMKGARIQPMRMGGSRQFVDAQGRITVWVDPMWIRLVLVREQKRR